MKLTDATIRRGGIGTRPDQPLLFREILLAAFSKFGNELTGSAFQGGRGPTLASLPVHAREATAELTDCGDNEVSQSLIGKGGDEFVQLGRSETRGQRVEAVRFRSAGDSLRRRGFGLLAGLIPPRGTRLGLGGCRCGLRGRDAEDICLSRVGYWLLCHVLIPSDQPTLMRHDSDLAAFGLKPEERARRKARVPRPRTRVTP